MGTAGIHSGPVRPEILISGKLAPHMQGDLGKYAHSIVENGLNVLEMLLNSLNRDMFKPFRSHRRLLG